MRKLKVTFQYHGFARQRGTTRLRAQPERIALSTTADTKLKGGFAHPFSPRQLCFNAFTPSHPGDQSMV